MRREKDADPIRVLHPITRLIIGGAQENTMYTAALLDKTRFRASIVSGLQTGSEGSLIEEVIERQIPLTILPSLVRQINPWKDGLALWKLFRLISKQKFTIVHTHSSKAGILGRLAARIAGTPIIIHTVHGWSFHDHMRPWLKKIYVALEKFVAKFSDCLIVVAEVDIEKGLREGIGVPEQYHLIRSAIPLSRFDPDLIRGSSIRRSLGLPTDVPVLGNVGRFSPQKNPLDWVEVAARVGDLLPDCHYLLVGDGPLRAEVLTQFKDRGILDRCVFTGLRRDIPQMLAAMDVFLLTSLWEGLPRVIPQSMAMGLPVVANRADGTIEAVVHGITGYLCNPGEIDEMAKFCVELLQNAALRKLMGENARSRVAGLFDLDTMIREIEDLYVRLLAQKGLTV